MNRNRVLASALAFAPFLGICFSVPLWDRVYPLVFGVPFNMAWLAAWIPLTSLCLWGVYRLRYSGPDRNAAKREDGRR